MLPSMPMNTTATLTTTAATGLPTLPWQADALCAQTGPEFFFPEPGTSVRDAKRLCAACPGRLACLEYALTHDERFGVWGGLSEQERLRLRRG